MNKVLKHSFGMEIAPENHLPTYKEISGGEVFKNPISGGAGDASLSPPQEHRHTPSLSLGAVSVPTFAPKGGEVSDANEPVRILLSKSTSDALTATGERAFVILHKTMRGVEEPDTIGRWAITLHPCSVADANAARRVAMGESKERKAKASKP